MISLSQWVEGLKSERSWNGETIKELIKGVWGESRTREGQEQRCSSHVRKGEMERA